jgi:PKD repeat protein
VGEGTNGNLVRNNLVGLSPAGTARLRNILEGVDYNTGASDNRVGGQGDLERNVISGNNRNGVEFSHGPTVRGNRAVGNFIGTDVTGTNAFTHTRNGDWGVYVEDGVQDTLVSDNVIGNARNGLIRISGYIPGQGSTRGTIVRDNRIGISLDGTPIPSYTTACCGIRIDLDTDTSQIGPGNIIAYNRYGIAIFESDNDRHTITRNSIFGNSIRGIDLQPVGSVTVNDFGDGDGGANQQLNYPALTSATPQEVRGDACAGCTVEVFLADGNGQAHGQGRTFLGDDVAGSNGRFSVPVAGISVGDFVTATATDANGNTSEFSLNLQVRANPTPAGTTIGSDAFGRSVADGLGKADFGGFWTTSGPAADYDVDGDDATIVTPAAGNTRRASLLSVSQRDVELHVRVRSNKQVQGGAQNVWLTARQQNLNNEYRLRARIAADGSVYLNASRVVGGAETFLGSDVRVPDVSLSPGAYLHLRGQVAGADPVQIRFKAWVGGSEPGGWQLTRFDSSSALAIAGAVGVGAYLGGAATNAPVTFSFDDFDGIAVDVPTPPPTAGFTWSQVPGSLTIDFTDDSSGAIDTRSWDFGDGSNGSNPSPNHAYPSPGTYTVTLTVTGPGGSDSRTKQVTVDPPAPTVYASDDFARTVTGGWGPADTGGAWTRSGAAADFEVRSNNGRMTTPAAGATRGAYLNAISRRDIDVTVRIATSKLAQGGHQFVFVVGRRVSSGLEYAAKLRFGVDGRVYLGVSRFDGGVETAVVTPSAVAGLTHAAGSFVWVRLRLDGANPTSVRAKAWANSGPEPAAWAIDTTDAYAALQAAGSVGLRAYLGSAATNAPVVFRFDEYQVTDPQP